MSAEDVVPLVADEDGWEGEVSDLLKVLERRPPGAGSASGERKEGYVLKKKRKSNKWTRYWCTLDIGNGKFNWYTSQESMALKGTVNISYVGSKALQEQDALAMEQHHDGKEVCKYRVSVFANGRHFVLSGESDVDVESWIDAFRQSLQKLFTEQEVKEKDRAARRLAPVIEDQEYEQMERYSYLRSVLAQTGFLSDEGPTKIKEGYLKLKQDDEEGSWRKYYFVLHKRYLNYYRLEDKNVPVGIIALKFMIAVDPVESKKQNRRFIISTPFRTYLLRGKHEVAVYEWINAIRTMKCKRDKKDQVELLTLTKEADAPPFSGTFALRYETGGRSKTYTASGSSVTIGRASTNHIKLADTKVSRNHCKVLMEGGKAMFYDLGSSRGSKVNNERVTTRALKVGDSIKVGDTVLTVESR